MLNLYFLKIIINYNVQAPNGKTLKSAKDKTKKKGSAKSSSANDKSGFDKDTNRTEENLNTSSSQIFKTSSPRNKNDHVKISFYLFNIYIYIYI